MKDILFKSLLIFSLFAQNCTTPNQPGEQKGTTSEQKAPAKIISLPGFSEGNEIFVDGPLWYDGEAKLQKYNQTILKLEMSISVPEINTGYQIKDGKIRILLSLTKENKKYQLEITDQNKENANYLFRDVKVKNEKISAGIFSPEKKAIKITTEKQNYTFIIEDQGKMSITADNLPASIGLIRKDLS